MNRQFPTDSDKPWTSPHDVIDAGGDRARRAGDPRKRGRTIGIDLGTSTSCVAAVVDGRPVIIPSRQGTNTTPSVLSIVPDGTEVVGHAAVRRLVLNPESTVYGSKRLVGRAYTDDLAEKVRGQFTYTLARTADHQFGADVDGRIISMQDVSATVLREVRQLAEAYFAASIDGAVITVPAFFGESQRESVRKAAQDARIPAIRIITEPTAAALAYGFHRGGSLRVAVVDLGAGTFDVSVVDVRDNKFQVLATGGDTMLGGMDIDDAIGKFLCEEFNRMHRTSLEPDPWQLARIREAAQECKVGLSVQQQYAVHIPQLARVENELCDLQVVVTRAKAEELTLELLDRMVTIARDVLDEQKIALSSIDELLFIGRATRWPPVRERMETFFGRRGSRRANPEEAVAMGAAILADDIGVVELGDVLPVSIGFAGSGRRFFRLVPRNTPVPVERFFVVRTAEEDQRRYVLPMFQGESSDAAENEYVGSLVIEGIPPGPKGKACELTLRIDAQCLMTAEAAEPTSGERLPVQVDRTRDLGKLLEELGPPPGARAPAAPSAPGALGAFAATLRRMFRAPAQGKARGRVAAERADAPAR